jgi:hypothetical protein
MQTYPVDGLNFDFPDNWVVGKYDDWSFYRHRFMRIPHGLKALDLLAVSPDHTAWLIEAKDYRFHRRTKPSNLADEVREKVLDTLAAVLPAKTNGDVASETVVSNHVAEARKLRVVLHLEQPANHSKLFPRAIDPADVQMKLRQQLKPVDAHPKVVEIANLQGVPWVVS